MYMFGLVFKQYMHKDNKDIDKVINFIKYTQLAGLLEEYLHTRLLKDNAINQQLSDGLFILSLIQQTEYFTLGKLDKNDSTLYFLATVKVLTYQQEFMYIDYVNLPMVCKPRPWTSFYDGGLLSKTELIHHSHFTKHETRLDNDLYLNAINKYNNIEYRVNRDILNYLILNPQYIIAYKDSSRQRPGIIDFMLNLFNVYSKQDTPFYLPLFGDWRGRIYVNSSYINYKGSSMSKSLLCLYKGEVLTEDGVKYFYIHGANVYGQDKIPFEARLEWVKLNYNTILSLDPGFISKAEDVLGFIAFSLELIKYNSNPNTLIHLILYQDATCSGLQHIYSILHDEILGEQVNVITNNLNMPKDVYAYVASKLKDNLKDNPVYQNMAITRSLIKKPVMTIPYGASLRGMADQLFSEATEVRKIYSSPNKYTREFVYQDVSNNPTIIQNFKNVTGLVYSKND